uniref:PPUP9150 n=1 Tax=Poeciliopsis prolifica TaxID=188132 RepID=A0A0S7EL67_9TELE
MLPQKASCCHLAKSSGNSTALMCTCSRTEPEEALNCTLAVKGPTTPWKHRPFHNAQGFLPASSHLNREGDRKPSWPHFTGSKTNFKIGAKASEERIWSHMD